MPTIAKPAPKASPKPQSSDKPVAASAAPPETLLRTLPIARPIDNAVTGMLAALRTLESELDAAYKKGAISLAKAFVVMRYLKDRMAAADSTFSRLFEDYQKSKLPALFEQEGVTSIPLEEGMRVGVSHKFFVSIRPDKKAEAYKWLQDNGLESLITETVNSSTLSAAIKAMQEEHNVEPPELYFNAAYVPNTSVAKV